MSNIAGDASQLLQAFVIDFTQAFWQVPIKPEERKYFCATAIFRGRRRYLVFLRAAQGSAMAPLLWCRIIACVCVLTQSLMNLEESSMLCYVDDPLAALAGTQDHIKAMVSMIVLTWEALGFKLAYPKGQFGSEVTWIGGTIQCLPAAIRVTIKESIIQDIMADLKRFLEGNVIAIKDLHSTTGKLNHAAGLLVILRPFVQPLWAALHATHNARGPPNCVWTKQIKTTLRWFQSFFDAEGTRLERVYTLEAYQRAGTVIEIGTDASPWGLGGWISQDGKITEFFSSPLTSIDEAKYGRRIGEADGQQIWECLAILVAVDVWHSKWSKQRVVLKVKGDNVAALTLLIKMRPSTPEMAVIARELALRLATLSFPPDAIHTPGIAHVVADKLSRIHSPDGDGIVGLSIHHALSSATAVQVPARTAEWYKTDTPDSASIEAHEKNWESWE